MVVSHRFVLTLTAAALLAGCSSATAPSVAPPMAGAASSARSQLPVRSARGSVSAAYMPLRGGSPHAVAPAAQPAGFDAGLAPVVYACEPDYNQCTVYRQGTKALLRTVTGLSEPQGTAVDASGNWYIANTAGSSIPVYKKNGAVLSKTLSDPAEYPVDAAVGSDTVAVSNIYTTSFTAGNLAIYVGGATTPSYALSDPNAFQGIGVAFDGSGNCYWSYNSNSGVGQIDEFPGCSPSSSPVNLGIATGFAGGIAVDKAGNLWYLDQYNGLYECSGTTSCAQVATGFGDPVFFDFSHADKALFIADYGNNQIDRSKGKLPAIGPDFIVTPWLSVNGVISASAQPPQ